MRKAAYVLATLVFCVSAPAWAQRLPDNTAPIHYALAFDVDLSHARFEGTETIHVRNQAPSKRIVLNAADLTFHDVRIEAGGQSQIARVTIDARSQTATLLVSKDMPAGEADVKIRFAGVLNNDLRGLYLSQANGRRYAVSQLESTDARRMYPCFDEPTYKATFSLSATIDRKDTAISNGRLLSDKPGPGFGRHTLTFATTPKMSSYLVALTVGDFECLSATTDNTPLRVCATPDKKALGAFALEAAQYALHYYNGYYATPYPFEKLDMVAVPDFAAGAMENTGAIFYRDTDLLVDTSTASIPALKNVASVVAHEMAHQWFGDLVTMKWWDDLWLNEGFATWMESRPVAAWHPEWHMDVDQALDTQRAIGLDSYASTHAIRSRVDTPAEIDESFDLIAYEKGAAVVRMIENYVGPDTFRRGVNAYLAAHAYGNATSEDFAAAIAEASGKPVDRILPTFVNQPGVPLVGIEYSCNGAGQFRETQRPFTMSPTNASATLWQIPICTKIGGGQPSCAVLESPAISGFIDVCTSPWMFGNAGALGYYRTEYAKDALAALAANAETALSAPERVSLLGDTWALVRSGNQNIGDYLTLASGFGAEPVPGVLEQVVSGLAFAGQHLTTDANRGRFETFIKALFGPRFAELGVVPAPGEDVDARALRPVIISALGTVANDEMVVTASRRALDAATAGTPLDPAAADAVVYVAASHGDRALWDALANAANHTPLPQDQYRYLYALGDFTEPGLVERGLQYVLTPNVRSQNAGRYLEGFLQNPAAGHQAWEFLKANWKDLSPKLSIAFSDVGVVQALGSFCDAGTRDDIKSFFTTHKLGNAARNVDQTIDKINNCIELKDKQSAAFDEWLLAHKD